jgi:hypothetical protein
MTKESAEFATQSLQHQTRGMDMTNSRHDVSAVAVRILAALTVLVAVMVGSPYANAAPANQSSKNRKLKIIFLMGQSNMVGYSRPGTAWYLTQPMYIPPAKMATAKSRFYNGANFYWSGLKFAQSDSEEYNARGAELYEQRRASRQLWRSRVYGADTGYQNDWKGWKREWGPRPGKNGEGWRGDMYRFLDTKAEEEGIYKRMEEYIESPQNQLHPKVALAQLGRRDEAIADDIKRVRDIFLKGTAPEDFDGLDEQIKAFGQITQSNRLAYAELVRDKVNLPIAERTYITAVGEVSGGEANGVLTLGYAKWADACGPEYPFGISFEQMVDGPVLIVKSAVGGTSVHVNWRPPSLANAETPIEKAVREAAGKDPQTGTGPLWLRTMAHIKQVLSDPGQYHPDYDPKAGYELAGVVWFQGWNDMGNPAYGEQLVHFIKDFRKEMNSPELPFVCGLAGHSGWAKNTFSGNVNGGMLYASKQADLKGTVDVVNTLPYMPIELGLLKSVEAAYGRESDEYKEAERIISRATCKDGTHYFGSAKFIYLTGDAMARKLANLLAGGEPTIHKEAEAILDMK